MKTSEFSIKNLKKNLDSSSILGSNSLWFYISLFVFTFLILFSRKPDTLLNAQFYAEDGVRWFADAYNIGAFKSLFIPYAGYLHIFPRLFASIALNFDLLYAPLFLNIIAILVRALVVFLFASSRFPFSLKIKLPIAFIYLALPGAWEVHANISNSYLHLALLSFMILIAEPSFKIGWRLFDTTMLILSSLTGPFCIFLSPIAFYCYLRSRKKQALFYSLIPLAASAIQFFYIKQFSYARAGYEALIPNPDSLFKVLFNQIFSTSLLGLKLTVAINSRLPSTIFSWLVLFYGLFCIAALCYTFWKSSRYQRLFLLLTSMLVLIAFWSSISRMNSSWQEMIPPGNHGRYYFLPGLAFVTSLIYLLTSVKRRFVQLSSGFLLGLLLVGTINDWRIPDFLDMNYKAQVQQFKSLSPGESYTFQTYPPNWNFTLVKRE